MIGGDSACPPEPPLRFAIVSYYLLGSYHSRVVWRMEIENDRSITRSSKKCSCPAVPRRGPEAGDPHISIIFRRELLIHGCAFFRSLRHLVPILLDSFLPGNPHFHSAIHRVGRSASGTFFTALPSSPDAGCSEIPRRERCLEIISTRIAIDIQDFSGIIQVRHDP